MSHRSGHYSEHTHHHGTPQHGKVQQRKQAHGHHRPDRNGYTLVHHGKAVRFGPVVFWIVAGSIIVMGGWSAATATYFAFRDDVLTRLIARQAEMQYAYEDRIAELRARVDRTTSRQLLDQEQYDQKLNQIMRRQALLEQRAAALNAMPDTAVTGSIKPASRAPLASEAGSTGIPKPSPINDTVIFVTPPDREARLESRAPASVKQRTDFAQSQGVDNALVNLQTALDKVEGRQIATLSSVEESYESRMRRMRGVITDLGLDLAQLEAAAPKGGIGGPFVPVIKPSSDAGAFERQLYRINLTRAQVDKLTRTLSLVPYRKPVIGNVEFSSGFGVRSDPFLGRPAMHTGLDFRAATGDPVRATANGKVVNAGWAGGYGRMVEIDHGNGLSTRYGHLSEIGVKVGEQIKIGQVIGAVGSTGRSTGPHLHYETRIDGDAVDPQKFLRAGVRLTQG
ncbi:peptidoglycan DD-metalloendopeptidase family protein [Bradyrhizobium sp. G127]|uniref:peptidoglycan DD-metalloendopeptidase family protein n=1 Tax=Bradyrhizobium sp. G127 TaxID=2904800 RepID=UPI001F413D44|nr:peptidoglycan DD-metalloendopeptidase family protein [Bradyrhizobium sp. G127]MCF2523471.1 peptidoglycan DD-metalloendopeptidase family protein [Bradyrhizobium sp. G127]